MEMAMQIREGEGHYFHYVATASNAPTLKVEVGEIRYWVQKGKADNNGSLLVSGKQVVGGKTQALPTPDEEGIFTLFVRGKDFKSEYEFRRGGVTISSIMKKELEGLPKTTVEKSFGTFDHRSESFYD
jgi:hypothetical protein